MQHDPALFTPFKNKRIFITGATGLIGSALVRTLAEANEELHLNLSLLALVRNPDKAKALFSDACYGACLTLIAGDLGTPFPDIAADYGIHAAAPTASKMMVEKPVEVFNAIVSGTRHFLEYARTQHLQASVVLSSLEVYGRPESPRMTEDLNGQLDPMRPRSSYPEGKRAAETLCAAYAAEYGVPVCVARLAQTFGSGVLRDDPRVFAQFARSVCEKRDIVLHTRGKTYRNYCSIPDAIQALLLLLNKGESGQAYNVASPGTYCSIYELADLFAAASSETSAIRFETPSTPQGYNPELKIQLDTSKLEALGYQPTGSLPAMIDDVLKEYR